MQEFYADHILPILTQDPYPSRGFAPIEALPPFDGQDFQYFDGIVPFVFQYRVYLLNGGGAGGMVWIWRAVPPTLL